MKKFWVFLFVFLKKTCALFHILQNRPAGQILVFAGLILAPWTYV